MNTNFAETAGNLKRISSVEEMEKSLASFKKKGYLKPKKVSISQIHELMCCIDPEEEFYIPKASEYVNSLAYTVTRAGKYTLREYVMDYQGKRLKRKQRPCTARVAKTIVQEAVKIQKKKCLWCDDTIVDLDFYLVILSVLDLEKYMELCMSDTVNVNAAVGSAAEESNHQLDSTIRDLVKKQASKGLSLLANKEEAIKNVNTLQALCSESTQIINRYSANHVLETDSAAIQDFFNTTAGMIKAHSKLDLCLGAVKRFEKFLQVGKERLERMTGRKVANHRVVDPMDYFAGSDTVTDEIAQYGMLIAQAHGFNHSDEMLSMPSLGFANFSKGAVDEDEAESEVEKFKRQMRNIGSKQLTEADVNRCIDLGWAFDSDYSLTYRGKSMGFVTIQFNNLRSYFMETAEGRKAYVRLTNQPPQNFYRAPPLATANAPMMTEEDMEYVLDTNPENADILLGQSAMVAEKSGTSKLHRMASQFATQVAPPTAALVKRYLIEQFLPETRRRRGAAALPTIITINEQIAKRADDLWRDTELGVKILDKLPQKYRQAFVNCEQVRMIGSYVRSKLETELVDYIDDFLTPYVVDAKLSMNIAIRDMKAEGISISPDLIIFKRLMTKYIALSDDVHTNAKELYDTYTKMADFKFEVSFRDRALLQSSGISQGTAMTAGGVDVANAITSLLAVDLAAGVTAFPRIVIIEQDTIQNYFQFGIDNIRTLSGSDLVAGFKLPKELAVEYFSSSTIGFARTSIWQPLSYSMNLLMLINLCSLADVAIDEITMMCTSKQNRASILGNAASSDMVGSKLTAYRDAVSSFTQVMATMSLENMISDPKLFTQTLTNIFKTTSPANDAITKRIKKEFMAMLVIMLHSGSEPILRPAYRPAGYLNSLGVYKTMAYVNKTQQVAFPQFPNRFRDDVINDLLVPVGSDGLRLFINSVNMADYMQLPPEYNARVAKQDALSRPDDAFIEQKKMRADGTVSVQTPGFRSLFHYFDSGPKVLQMCYAGLQDVEIFVDYVNKFNEVVKRIGDDINSNDPDIELYVALR